MGQINSSPNALLFQAVMASDISLINKVENVLAERYGPVKCHAGPVNFSDRTDYYEREMGSDLLKSYFIFNNPITLDGIFQYKLDSNRIEAENTVENRRRVNIDPGVLTLFNFSLLTTKGFSHRIYLAEGVYSELTLYVHGGNFLSLPWTYPDYLQDRVIELLHEGRNHLKSQK